MNLFSVTF